uniref:Uncharacterized protein n=1 Tax=Dulem virus 42 TaxID=3145760 RepID=A0AAU8B8S9_9CAUD
MQNASSTSTQSKFGESYTSYGGFDANGIIDYTKAQNTADTTNLALSGLTTGASIGSVFGPIGSGVGAVLGGLFGGFFGGSKARERRRYVEQEIRNTTAAQEAYNLQSEAEAGSRGLRKMFNATHGESSSGGVLADKGKSPNQYSTSNQYGQIFTPSGISYGQVQGYASPDEGEIDMSTGETTYNGNPSPYVRDRRADIIPVGIEGASDNGAFADNVGIPGHLRDIDGIMFADKARPYFKENEIIKQEIDNVQNGKGDRPTKKYMLNKLQNKYQANSQAIADIVDRQSQVTQLRQ